MIAVLRQLLVSQDFRGNREFPIAAEGMEEESPITIWFYRCQTHSKNTFLSPLKIQASDIVIARQRIRHEVAVRYSPGCILLPGIHDQTVAEFVGHVSEGIVATVFSQINRDIGDKGILDIIKEKKRKSSNRLKIRDVTQIERKKNCIPD